MLRKSPRRLACALGSVGNEQAALRFRADRRRSARRGGVEMPLPWRQPHRGMLDGGRFFLIP